MANSIQSTTSCSELPESKATDAFSYPGMERWKGRTAIVTGASAGIGYETAKRLAQLGVVVVGCARNIAAIETLSQELSPAGGKLVAMKCDVSKEEDILSMMSAIKSQFGGADICINNAGLGLNAPILSGSTESWRELIEINVLGLCVMTREFIKQLRERGVDDGHVIFMNSVCGHWVFKNSMYCVTKFAVTALTEGFRTELRAIQSNIKVSSISPGLVRTEFLPRLQGSVDPKNDIDSAYANTYGFVVLEAEDIASAVMYILGAPHRMQVMCALAYDPEEVGPVLNATKNVFTKQVHDFIVISTGEKRSLR